MTVLKCKMCGGNLEVQEGMHICECEYCGSVQTVPALDNEKKITLFARANRLRSAGEFDKASGVYESIVTEFPEEAEAYWGLVLCKYGIEYVDDPKTGKKIPTCHRSSFENVMDDGNFEMVMEYSDSAARAVYREEAKAIERLRMNIIEVSSKEEPYDIFICYKETDAKGERTIDSVIAQEVYDVLTEKGYRVFFARITLEDKLGQEYEPYIFAALHSAKIMLAFGTDYEYYNAVWVKNEWSRFLSLIEKGEKKTLIPCYKGIDAYDMPKEFARLQAQDMGKVGAIQDLVRGIGKILGTKNAIAGNRVSRAGTAEITALLQRGNMALEDKDFKGAEDYFERALDIDPSDAHAYVGKFLSIYGLASLDDLEDKVFLLEDSKEFRRAMQFADAALSKRLEEIKESNELKIERLRLIDVMKKCVKKRTIVELSSMKREAYFQIMSQSANGEKRARNIYANLLGLRMISPNEYSQLIERISVIRGIGAVLGDYELHPKSDIIDRYKKYAVGDITQALQELISCKCVERCGNKYCWAGARDEKDRLLKEAEERRKREEQQKAAYSAACEAMERQIMQEAAGDIDSVSQEYDPQIHSLQNEMDEAIAAANRQRDAIQSEISSLQNQKNALNFLKIKEKRALQVQIDEAQARWNGVMSPQQIQSQYQPRIDVLTDKKKEAIDTILKKVRSKHTMPKYEDFESPVSGTIS